MYKKGNTVEKIDAPNGPERIKSGPSPNPMEKIGSKPD